MMFMLRGSTFKVYTFRCIYKQIRKFFQMEYFLPVIQICVVVLSSLLCDATNILILESILLYGFQIYFSVYFTIGYY